MNSRQIPLLISAVSASMISTVAVSQNKPVNLNLKKRPNIVFIFTDQQNVKAVSAHGNTDLNTPNIDFLVKNGVSYTNSYCTSPVCGPSRSSLITGKMPHETGVDYNNGASIKKGIPNIGEILSKSGYETVWGGKWHLPESYPAKNQKNTSLPGFKLLKFYHPDSTAWELGGKTDKHLADAVTNYIKDYNKPEPFLLCVSFHNPHDICYFPRRPEQYPNPGLSIKLPPLPVNHSIASDEPELLANSRIRDHYGDELLLSQNNDETRWRSYLWYYYRMTEAVDFEIGRVLKALTDKGLDENTLIIFSSDHGDGMGENKWAAKLSLRDGPAKVPFVLYYKNGIPTTGINDHQLVSGLDVVPTILDFANIQPGDGLKGISLRKAINSPSEKHRDFVVTELAVDPFDQSLTGRMIRTKQFKYNIYSKGQRKEELYDMINDPLEMNNISKASQFQLIKKQLKDQLKGWLQQTNDPFLVNLK